MKESVFTATITDLSHDTNYRLRTIIYYNLATSTSTEWSPLIRTLSLSEPGPIISDLSQEFDVVGSNAYGGIVLTFSGPDDDGGLPILGFHIYARHIEKPFPSNWIYVGPFFQNLFTKSSRLEIKNSLLPETIYEFRLSAYNSMGSGPISITSNKIHTGNISIDTMLYFSRPIFDHSHIPRSISENWKKEHLKYYKYNTSKVMTIIFSKQKLFSSENPNVIFDGWRCHWTSNDYTVVGQSVWANPSDANSDLINKNITDGRIVWILRGNLPIISKALRAQSAGAIGIVLVDNGRCTTYDQKCIPGADKKRGEYFAQLDKASFWVDLKIPMIFVLLNDGNSLAAKLDLRIKIIETNSDAIKVDTMNNIKNDL